jgi:DNA repair protein RadA/Sms
MRWPTPASSAFRAQSRKQARSPDHRLDPDHVDRNAERGARFGVSQVRESAARLVRYAKERRHRVFLVGHVTKEGGIAGPRVLEHMVDAVLYFEGEAGSRFRVLRAFKNRFGAVNELGVFAMSATGPARGAESVGDFPVQRTNADAGQRSWSRARARAACWSKCRRWWITRRCRIRAASPGPRTESPGDVARGAASSRRDALHDQDVFVNVVGGIRVQETAADLPVLLAVLSSFRGIAGRCRRSC